MGKKYTQLDARMRSLIAAKFNTGEYGYRRIAAELGVSVNTAWQEIHRNKVRASGKTIRTKRVNNKPVRLISGKFMYDPVYAQARADQRRGLVRCPEKIVPGGVLYDKIDELLREKGHKPDVIAGRLKLDYPDETEFHVSHETIYRYTYAHPESGWSEYFVRERKKRKKQSQRKSSIPNRVSIHKRPAEVETRTVFGHFEGDTIVGYAGNPSKTVVATLTERMSRMMFAGLSADKSSVNTIDVIDGIVQQLPTQTVKTLTFDNGSEFVLHGKLTKAHGTRVFFADPYSSSQRGTNERHNGLLRRFFPKGTDFGTVTDEELQEAVTFWNNYPRKILGYRTPLEVWEGAVSQPG